MQTTRGNGVFFFNGEKGRDNISKYYANDKEVIRY